MELFMKLLRCKIGTFQLRARRSASWIGLGMLMNKHWLSRCFLHTQISSCRTCWRRPALCDGWSVLWAGMEWRLLRRREDPSINGIHSTPSSSTLSALFYCHVLHVPHTASAPYFQQFMGNGFETVFCQVAWYSSTLQSDDFLEKVLKKFKKSLFTLTLICMQREETSAFFHC